MRLMEKIRYQDTSSKINVENFVLKISLLKVHHTLGGEKKNEAVIKANHPDHLQQITTRFQNALLRMVNMQLNEIFMNEILNEIFILNQFYSYQSKPKKKFLNNPIV